MTESKNPKSKPSKPTVIVFGIGDVGFGLVHELARFPGLRVVACRRSETAGRQDVNLLTVAAEASGRQADLQFETVDLANRDEVRAILEAYTPELVYQCATALPYWRISEFPDQVSEKLLSVGIGWTAPMNLQYPIVVGRAIREAGLENETLVLNASAPDYTNPVVDSLGLPIDCGIGNIGGGRISMLERGAAARLEEPRADVTVRAAFPHAVAAALRVTQSTGGRPYYLQVRCRGTDVTEDVDPQNALRDGWPEIPSVPPTDHGYPLAVASSVRIITGMLHDTGQIAHAPGPNGRPGGWPVRLSRDGVEPVIPPGTNESHLREINLAGLRGDGIETIRDDGTIVYTERSYDTVRDAIGYDCRELSPDELGTRRQEIEQALSDL